MKKILICILILIAVVISFAVGGIIGFHAGYNRYYYAEPPKGPYNWYYQGTVIESTIENADEFVITVELSDNFDNTVRTFRITPQTSVVGEISPEILQPGDRVEFFVKTYHHLPEVLCELFYAKFVND